MSPAPRYEESTAAALYVSLELGSRTWVMVATPAMAQRPRQRKLAAGDLETLLSELTTARRRFGLDATAPVFSCYEAGGQGFWLHRWLERHGIRNVVVDSASIRVSRRRREAKTDRLDGEALVRMLIRYAAGEARVWSVIRVPTAEAEDRRQLNREWDVVKRDRRRVGNRIASLLATHGIRPPRNLMTGLATLRTADGQPLGPMLRARLARESAQLATITERYQRVAAARQQQLRLGTDPVSQCARRLLALPGIGPVGAEILSAEVFATRTFQNGRQLGALVGLVPTPYRSDQQVHEQGHSRAGRGAVRGVLTQLAWGWLRFQPHSALTRWFHRRFAASAGLRRLGIIAVARKLLIALWHYVAHDVVPEGARLRA